MPPGMCRLNMWLYHRQQRGVWEGSWWTPHPGKRYIGEYTNGNVHMFGLVLRRTDTQAWVLRFEILGKLLELEFVFRGHHGAQQAKQAHSFFPTLILRQNSALRGASDSSPAGNRK